MTDTSYTVVVNSDNIESKSKDKARINRCVSALKAAGYNAIASGVNPHWHVTDMRTRKNSYIVNIVGGLCAGTIHDYAAKYYQNYMKNNNNKAGQAYFAKYGKYKCPAGELTWLEKSWDDNFSGSSFKGCNPKTELKKANFDDCYGVTEEDFVKSVVNMVKYGGTQTATTNNENNTNTNTSTSTNDTTTSTSNTSGSTSTKIVEGFIEGGRSETPQFWNTENYTEYEEIEFTNFRIIDENPRVMSATFETPTKLDIMDGRAAVLITGDCDDFGGIIIESEYKQEDQIYKYTCQGFMDRVLASTGSYVFNGTKTVRTIIAELLADCGLPDVNLLNEDEYDTAVTKETQDAMKSDKDLTETSDAFDTSDPTTRSSSSENKVTPNAKTVATNKAGDVINPFKKKPVGIYSQILNSDLIRALIFEYGVNVDFYGDINGIPHFDIIDLEAWKKSGWQLNENMGFASDYEYTVSITDILTQVGVENISAINGTGELYTAKELFGVNLDDYVGTMGTVIDNPTTEGELPSSDQETITIEEKYQDSSGKGVELASVLNTNGKPGCSKCSQKNGGMQPTYQNYSKSWLNKCPGCGKEKTLYNTVDDLDGKTVCNHCKLTYCQYCGYEKENGKYQLTELFQTQTATQTELKSTSGDTTNTTTNEVTT